jgi:hypothetical protein
VRGFPTYNLISKNNALGIVVLEPFISLPGVSEHLRPVDLEVLAEQDSDGDLVG